MTQMISNFGFCYVVTNEGYLAEALRSLDSLRKVMPDVAVAFICPPSLCRSHPSINYWIPLVNPLKGPIVKANAILAPFSQVAFVDTDTYFARDISDVFRILEYFDIALAHEPTRGLDYQVDAPPAFSELNTGFIVFRNDTKMRVFFDKWLAEFGRMLAEQKLHNDQPSFRSALWKSPEIRVATLTSEYHCICGKPVSIAWEARLLHDRGDLPVIEMEINRLFGCRTYVPGWGLLQSYSGHKEWIKTYLRLSMNFLKVLLFSHYRQDHSKKIPVQWAKGE